jgi:histidinol phosphatase-like enzyme
MSDSRILVGVDRDNTITHDDRYGYFGKNDDWRDKVKFCHGAIGGLRILSDHPDITLCVFSRQRGVARGVLTSERVLKVNEFIHQLLQAEGIHIDSWHFSPYDVKATAHKMVHKGYTSSPEYIVDENDPRHAQIKPGIGLVHRAIDKHKLNFKKLTIFLIGDRADDVKTGLNAGGIGILVDNSHVGWEIGRKKECATVLSLMKNKSYKDKIFIVKDLKKAAKLILSKSMLK